VGRGPFSVINQVGGWPVPLHTLHIPKATTGCKYQILKYFGPTL